MADQIIDLLLLKDKKRYKQLEELRDKELYEYTGTTPDSSEITERAEKSTGTFVNNWIEFEKRVRRLSPVTKSWFVPTTALIAKIGDLDERSGAEIDRIRRFRNNLVHGIDTPSADEIDEATRVLKAIIGSLPKPAPKDGKTNRKEKP